PSPSPAAPDWRAPPARAGSPASPRLPPPASGPVSACHRERREAWQTPKPLSPAAPEPGHRPTTGAALPRSGDGPRDASPAAASPRPPAPGTGWDGAPAAEPAARLRGRRAAELRSGLETAVVPPASRTLLRRARRDRPDDR